VDRTIAGEPSDRIVQEFNAKGVPSPEGKGWANDSLRKLLRRPILRGMQVHQGELVRGPDGLPIRPHEPLLADDEWQQLQNALEARAHRGGWWRKPPHLLKGIAVCDLCGRTLHNVDQAGKSGALKCSRHIRNSQRCPGVVIHRERLEAHVEETFLNLFGDVQITEEETMESMSGEALEIEEALDFVTAKLRDVDDEDEEAMLLAQRRQLRARKKELASLPAEPTVRVIELGETYAERWARSDLTTRRALLASMVKEIRVRKGRRGGRPEDRQPTRDRVDIHWRGL
jgi:site-specific DNA recombinase